MKTIDEQIQETREQLNELQEKLSSLEEKKTYRYIDRWVYFRSNENIRYFGRVVDVIRNDRTASFTCHPLYRVRYNNKGDIIHLCKYKEETKAVENFDVDRDLIDGEKLMLLLKKVSDFANDND